MKALLNMYINGNSSMEQALFDYADQSDIIQRVNNPSGGYTTGGLGEPKYNVDNTAFTGNVRRPPAPNPTVTDTDMHP